MWTNINFDKKQEVSYDVTVGTVCYNVGTVFSLGYKAYLFTLWNTKYADSTINCSLLLHAIGCTDSYHWITV